MLAKVIEAGEGLGEDGLLAVDVRGGTRRPALAARARGAAPLRAGRQVDAAVCTSHAFPGEFSGVTENQATWPDHGNSVQWQPRNAGQCGQKCRYGKCFEPCHLG